MLLGSVLLLCYPLLSNMMIEESQNKVYAEYSENIANINEEELNEALNKAYEYNEALFREELSDEELERRYLELLKIEGNDIMGYIEIPKLDINLPIYHGCDGKVLEKGCGHLFKSSLPVGGINSRAIITAHSGLSNQKMFTDIELLENGDLICLEVLGQKLAYEVYDKTVVLPYEAEKIKIVPNEDNISLVTCTPFGVNTHRLVITAKRIEITQNVVTQIAEVSEAVQSSVWEKEYHTYISLSLLSVVGLCTVIILPIRHLKKKHK